MLYHVTTREEWMRAQAGGVYHPSSLDTEGFIHASFASQVFDVANARFRGQTNLVLLCIDSSGVSASIREDVVLLPGGQNARFPHIYGPLNIAAVVRVFDLPPVVDGTFALPAEAV